LASGQAAYREALPVASNGQASLVIWNENRLPVSHIDEGSVSLYLNSNTVNEMFFRLTPTAGNPLYMQLMQQIRLAVENGALQDGEQLPGIRTLAEELLVSPNTVAKAYSELEYEGILELRQGSGAFVFVDRRTRSQADQIQAARGRVEDLIEALRDDGLLDDQIRRMFEAELLHQVETVRSR
jgi:GntR family transcriptional regulator